MAARLTGIKIDIKNEEQYTQEERARMDAHFQVVTGEEQQSSAPAPSAEAIFKTDEEKAAAPPDEIDEGAVTGDVPEALEITKDEAGLPLIPPTAEVPVESTEGEEN